MPNYFSFTGKTRVNAIGLLFTLQNTADLYCGEVSGLVLETEAHWGNLYISIGAGYHLYRDIDAKDTFHVY